jgi:chromate transporter
VTPSAPTLPALGAYFLRLGATGFGGPVALASHMRRDLVDGRGWITPAEYDAGLAIAAACPGPLAYQLGVYCGYVRFGVRGGLTVALAFALVPFLLVTAVAAGYTRLAGTAALRGIFRGVGPVVVALILKACWNLGRKTLRGDALACAFAAVACAVTALLERELTPLFLVAGGLGAILFAGPPDEPRPAPEVGPPSTLPGVALAAVALPQVAATKLFVFFFKTGLLVFGSGLVIVPFLKTSVVDEFHWLTNQAFLDAVAVGLVSPGPVVITATFVGYLVGGLPGALAATLGIFTPAVAFTLLATPLLLRHGRNRRLAGIVRGVTVTVVGVLVGTTWLVARSVVVDVLSVLLLLAAALAALRWPRLPDPVLVAMGAAVGLAVALG